MISNLKFSILLFLILALNIFKDEDNIDPKIMFTEKIVYGIPPLQINP